jgi:hypothetical protein
LIFGGVDAAAVDADLLVCLSFSTRILYYVSLGDIILRRR